MSTKMSFCEANLCQDLTTVTLDIKASYDYQMKAGFISILLANHSVKSRKEESSGSWNKCKVQD